MSAEFTDAVARALHERTPLLHAAPATRVPDAARFAELIEEGQQLRRRFDRMARRPDGYVRWEHAGGSDECRHGYAAGIPCPDCDADPEERAHREAVATEARQRQAALDEAALLEVQ